MSTMNIFDLTDTWNAGGTTFTAIKMNATDTASAAGSLLIDLQIGGVSQFRVSKGGRITAQTLTFGLGGQTSVATNTALGFEALNNASLTGTNNVGVGYQALLSNTSGGSNSAMGAGALAVNTTGANNSAMSAGALAANTTGASNVAFGVNALFVSTTGSGNSAVGQGALRNNTTGGENSAVGQQALFSSTTANYNVAVGRSALLYYDTSNNTAVGYQAATGSATVANNTGSNLTAVGYQALANNTSGASNSAVGYQAGNVITTGARNTIIGAGSGPSAAAGADETVVGEGLTGKGNDTAFIGGTNGAYNEKNVTTWETTSDARIKKNIISNGVGLEVISQIDVRNFEYRTAEEITDLPTSAAINQPGTQLGVIAQELQAVLPECVTENSTGVLSVNTDPLIWYLVNAVKQLSAEIQTLKGA